MSRIRIKLSMSSGRCYFQIEDAVARAMQPFVDQLVTLSKDVRQLKGDESEENEVSMESSEDEPCQKKARPNTSTPKAAPQKKKGNKVSPLTVKLPPPAQIDLSHVDDDYIKREAG